MLTRDAIAAVARLRTHASDELSQHQHQIDALKREAVRREREHLEREHELLLRCKRYQEHVDALEAALLAARVAA